MKEGRIAVEYSVIDSVFNEVRLRLERVMSEKGDNTYISRHEAFGIISEEYKELWDELKAGLTNDGASPFDDECMDLLIACLWHLASKEAYQRLWDSARGKPQ